MNRKLFDSERKIMDVLWREGEQSAGQLAKILKEETGWNRNTTYTVIKKCIDKGVVQRLDPGFICIPLIDKEQIQQQEAQELIDKVFDGSAPLLFASLLGNNKLSSQEIETLKQMIKDLD